MLKFIQIIGCCLIFFSSTLGAWSQTVRVALLEEVQNVVVSPRSSMSVKRPGASHRLALLSQPATVKAHQGGLKVGDLWVEGPLWLVDQSGVITIEGVRYRGYCVVYPQDDRLLVVNHVGLKDYVASVLGGEISPSWPRESIRAHAVATKSYVCFMMEHPRAKEYDVFATVMDQVYHGTRSDYPETRSAVQYTWDDFLYTSDGRLVKSFYSSNCGGHTAWSEGLFPEGNEVPLSGVPDSYCAGAPNSSWVASLSGDSVAQKMSKHYPEFKAPIKSWKVVDRRRSGRIKKVEVVDNSGRQYVFSGANCRRWLGARSLKSQMVDFTPEYSRSGALSRLVMRGKGWGHGVGLCQWGCKGAAEKGLSYKAILQHYYPGCRLARWR